MCGLSRDLFNIAILSTEDFVLLEVSSLAFSVAVVSNFAAEAHLLFLLSFLAFSADRHLQIQ
jgi:hypothetical protein